MVIKCFDRLLDLSTPRIMGILNMTPDSFYDGGRYISDSDMKRRIDSMIEEGVDIIDIGGMSTRPGAELVETAIEIERISPAIEYINTLKTEVFISVDTVYGHTARFALENGVDIINDVSAWSIDEEMLSVLEAYTPAYVLMHTRGTPDTMSQRTDYSDLIHDIAIYFVEKIKLLSDRGVTEVIIDPGFGFAKTLVQNYELLKKMSSFRFLDCPLLAGISRKSMFYKFLNISPSESLIPTSIAHYECLCQGSRILRVHDVKEAKYVIDLWKKLKEE